MPRKTDHVFLLAGLLAGAWEFVDRLFASPRAKKRRRLDVGQARKAGRAALSAHGRLKRHRRGAR